MVTYHGNAMVAQVAATALNGMKLGGVSINARVMATFTQAEVGQCVFLSNILTEDDLDDEDCLQESLNDIKALVSKYGRVKDLEVIHEEDGQHFVKVTYDSNGDAKDAVQAALAELNGMVVSGLTVKATSSLATPSKQDVGQEPGDAESDTPKQKQASEDENNTIKAKTDDPVKPLYSGDKLIPERFAEAKRVPKIPNAPGPREYAKCLNDESVKPLLTEMLGELMRLQKRAVEENNTKAKRRLVMGLREVARGIRSHKVKMVIMANNLDEYGAIDAKLQEIIDLANNEDVPLFFEFTKKNLGKALGKTIKIAVVGVQSADGAYQPFKKLLSLASKV
jgi:selenocysteine insertion sequence-binding protein 2